jgi:hypothetical protein
LAALNSDLEHVKKQLDESTIELQQHKEKSEALTTVKFQLEESLGLCQTYNLQIAEQEKLAKFKSDEIGALKSKIESLKWDQDSVSKVNGESL